MSLLVILSIIHCIHHQVCRLTFKLSDLCMVEMLHFICSQFYASEKNLMFSLIFGNAMFELCCRIAN